MSKVEQEHPRNVHPAQGATRMQPLGPAGREIEIQRHLTLDSNVAFEPNQNGDAPLKGGTKTGTTVAGRMQEGLREEGEGKQAVYLIRKRGAAELEVPVIVGGEEGEEAILVFSIREKAKLYLQAAKLDEAYEPGEIAPPAMGALLRQARAEGIHYLAVDPHRQAQYQGDPLPVLDLQRVGNDAGTGIYAEIQAMRRG